MSFIKSPETRWIISAYVFSLLSTRSQKRLTAHLCSNRYDLHPVEPPRYSTRSHPSFAMGKIYGIEKGGYVSLRVTMQRTWQKEMEASCLAFSLTSNSYMRHYEHSTFLSVPFTEEMLLAGDKGEEWPKRWDYEGYCSCFRDAMKLIRHVCRMESEFARE